MKLRQAKKILKGIIQKRTFKENTLVKAMKRVNKHNLNKYS